MDFKNFNFEQKCVLMGKQGESHVAKNLIKSYPPDQFIIINLHDLCELDIVVIEKVSGKLKEVREVKTTTKNKNSFKAGSQSQLAHFELQRRKMIKGKEYVPCYLHVLRVKDDFFDVGTISVIREEVYPLEKLKIDFDNLVWHVGGNQNAGY